MITLDSFDPHLIPEFLTFAKDDAFLYKSFMFMYPRTDVHGGFHPK